MAQRPILTDYDMGGIAWIRNHPAPQSDSDLIRQSDLKAAIEGINWKDNVRAASVANVTVATPGATIDGVTMAANDRVLLKNQTSQPENGLWIWNGAATPLTRALDGSTFDELESAVVIVDEGSTNVGTTWRQTQVNGVIGTNNVVFTAFLTGSPAASETVSGIAELATQAETDAGTDDLRIVTPLKLATSVWAARSFAQTIGDASATSITVTHNFNTRDVRVFVYENSGSFRQVECEVRMGTVNAVTLLFNVAPALNALRAVVKRG